MPVKSDALVVGFRRWLNKYAGGQVDWGGKYSGSLPPLPPREQVFERYPLISATQLPYYSFERRNWISEVGWYNMLGSHNNAHTRSR